MRALEIITNDMETKAREILIALAIRNNGDWGRIYEDVKNKTYPTDEEIKQAKSVKCITILDEEYPNELKQSFKPPFVLFYEGDINLLKNNNKDNVAYMGTREPSKYATDSTKALVDQDKHTTIITSLSKGIGTIAAQRAIADNKHVIAVLPCGLQAMTNDLFGLAQNIIDNKGLVLTEYPDNVAQDSNTCVMRNRIVVALSHELRITEAKDKSSVNVAISWALTQGKDVSVLPHNVSNNCINNKLIQDGAEVLLLS